ncbi:hypothetical protein M422DRAFT_268483 [Sphaerobolus stellatus SS14]|uniref:Uncharacterized protein n=1 Tax=Sphaerobolus stellatus (strain SS14) TaxID=990650 RepID=A0A0C9UMH6_SPHS4|nr:hypothetical protein M422DRAFT_268483 [Sphaerobolus stellatus SS14]
MLLRAEVDTLETLFTSLPQSPPESHADSKLPPHLDYDFSQGLRIEERGKGLTETISLLRWCLKELSKINDTDSASLVCIWTDTLSDAAIAAAQDEVAFETGQPRHAPKPNAQLSLCETVSGANDCAKAPQASGIQKKRWVYVSADGMEYSSDPNLDQETLKEQAAKPYLRR